jgi:exopolysaccharide biosynthesis protein
MLIGMLALLCSVVLPALAGEVTWNTADVVSTPFPAVTYIARSGTVIRDNVTNRIAMHIARVDLTAPGVRIRARVQPPTDNAAECKTETTLNAVSRGGAQIGINANYFAYRSGSNAAEVNTSLLGMASDRGVLYSRADDKRYGVNFAADNTVTFFEPADTNLTTVPAVVPYNVVSSQPSWLIRNGVLMIRPADGGTLNPMTGFGVTTNRVLVLLVCDGRDASWSDGASAGDLAWQLRREGCVDAIALDGGGSSTLVFADPKPRVVNRVPNRVLRAVGNNLLVYVDGAKVPVSKEVQ